MPDWFSGIAVALIGLVGTMIVAYLGYRQWRLSRNESLRIEASKSKRQSYESLWKLVEAIHVDLRRDPKELQYLQGRISQVNAYILQNEMYLADGDHELVNRYLQALHEMILWAQREGDAATKELLYTTADIPREATAVIRAFDLRDELKERIRKIIQA